MARLTPKQKEGLLAYKYTGENFFEFWENVKHTSYDKVTHVFGPKSKHPLLLTWEGPSPFDSTMKLSYEVHVSDWFVQSENGAWFTMSKDEVESQYIIDWEVEE